MLPGAFAASYPSTREALCSEAVREGGVAECDCELDSEGAIEDILMDEAKRAAKVAVLMKEVDVTLVDSQ